MCRDGSVYRSDAMPISEAGSSLEPLPDDGSEQFEALYQATRDGNTLRRVERKKNKKRKK